MRGRNPLFIKSEFSQSPVFRMEGCFAVAILYSSSQNSLLSKLEEALHIVNDGRNPLFIKSEFSLYERYCYWKRDAQEVAILYSSSQNSLRTPFL